MMRQSWLISALIMGGSLAFAPKTLAQVIPVPFEGTVPGACDATVLEPGVLGYELIPTPSGSGGLLSSGSGGPEVPSAPEGQSAFVEINCSSSANLSVEFPEKVGGPPIGTPVAQDAVVFGGIPDISASQGNSEVLSPGVTPVDVDMFVQYDEPLVGGDYQFIVNLLIAPN